MGLKRKEKKKVNGEVKEKKVKENVESEGNETKDDQPEIEDMVEDEEIPEWKDTDNKKTADYQKEFKVLGQETFVNLSKVNVTSGWVDKATFFPAEIIDSTTATLSNVVGLPDIFVEKVTKNIESWFPVQKAVLPSLISIISNPPLLRPSDVTISAPTGSGKTICYVLPLLLAVGTKPIGKLIGLIVVPVQTLVKQIEQELERFNACGASIVTLCGSKSFDQEQRHLSNGCIDIIVATPGRLIEHLLHDSNYINLSHLQFLIVDEADRMGPMTRHEWLNIVERRSGGSIRAVNIRDTVITRHAPMKILLSATLSKDIEELHMWNLYRPRLFRATATSSIQVEIAEKVIDHMTGGGLALPTSISHLIITSEKKYHPLILYTEIRKSNWKKVLVFTNEKDSSLRLSLLLNNLVGESYKVEQLTSDLFGNRRTKVLRRFKSGATRVLICSDVLSRGVDVDDVDCVVNYDLPKDDRLFVHRAGRTGRAGKQGQLISMNDQVRSVFVKMLHKTGLWLNTTEKTVEESELGEDLDVYKKALNELKTTVTKESSSTKQQSVSGFANRGVQRHRKYVMKQVKERAIKNEEKLKRWKKEKKDF